MAPSARQHHSLPGASSVSRREVCTELALLASSVFAVGLFCPSATCVSKEELAEYDQELCYEEEDCQEAAGSGQAKGYDYDPDAYVWQLTIEEGVLKSMTALPLQPSLPCSCHLSQQMAPGMEGVDPEPRK